MKTRYGTAQNPLLFAALTVVSLVLSGCGGGGGGSGSTGSSLSLGITDAPVDGVSAVVIEFTKVQVHSSNGGTQEFVLSAPKQVDLMQWSAGNSTQLLDHQSLPAGQYDWIRLFVNTTYPNSHVTTTGGQEVALTIPSNAQTGLKLNHPFTLATDGVASFVIDFNLRQSLHLANGAYKMRPTLRIVDATLTGGITGTVDASLVNAQGCADINVNSGAIGGSVYVYSNAGVTPVDVNTSLTSQQPLSTASVTLVNNTTWEYTAAYLDPGVYTVAFTCQSTADIPDTTDNIVFLNAADVPVTSGADTVHNFP